MSSGFDDRELHQEVAHTTHACTKYAKIPFGAFKRLIFVIILFKIITKFVYYYFVNLFIIYYNK